MVEENLSNKELQGPDRIGVVKWVGTGIDIQKHCLLHYLERARGGSKPSKKEAERLERLRTDVQDRIDTWLEDAGEILPQIDFDDLPLSPRADRLLAVPLPSQLNKGPESQQLIATLGKEWERVSAVELDLWVAEANELLEEVRQEIGY